MASASEFPSPGEQSSDSEGGGVGRAPGETGGIDPLFRGEEAPERAPKRAALLFQFFLFPLMIVAFAVGVFLLFGAIAGSAMGPAEALAQVTEGGENAQKQATHQLAVLIAQEKQREREAAEKGRTDFVPFYADPDFRARLVRAFEDSFPDKSPDRKAFLAEALGAVGDPAFAASLAAHARDAKGGDEDPTVRFAIAQALGNLRAPEAVPALAAMAKDPDAEVRNVAVGGLSQVHGKESTDALKAALADASPYVRLNAAAALAMRGDAAGLSEIEPSLDPHWYRPVAEGGIALSHETRAAAIANAIRSVRALDVTRLRPQVEAFLDDGDPSVRRIAREVLDQWPRPPETPVPPR